MKGKKEKSNNDLMALHEEIIKFGVHINTESSKKMDTGHYIKHSIYTVFYRISAFAIILHRATKTLCLGGWTHVTPLLLRVQLECAANCLAVIKNDCPGYMAFKFLYHPYVVIFRDEAYSEDARKKAETDILKGIKKLSDQNVRNNASEFVYKKKVQIFWFQPEEENVSRIIEKYGGAELKFTYKTLSMSTHAGHFGLLLFKDDPDKIEINPCENPVKTKDSILLSSKLLLEFLNIRNEYEGLGLNKEFERLSDKIDSIKTGKVLV